MQNGEEAHTKTPPGVPPSLPGSELVDAGPELPLSVTLKWGQGLSSEAKRTGSTSCSRVTMQVLASLTAGFCEPIK